MAIQQKIFPNFTGNAFILGTIFVERFFMGKLDGFWMIVGLVGFIVYFFCFFGTIAMAAEKNRKPLLWLPFAIPFAPITFIMTVLIDYAPRKSKVL